MLLQCMALNEPPSWADLSMIGAATVLVELSHDTLHRALHMIESLEQIDLISDDWRMDLTALCKHIDDVTSKFHLSTSNDPE